MEISAGFTRSTVALLAVSTVIPILPVVAEYTHGLTEAESRSYSLMALGGASTAAVCFLFAAPPVFDALAVTVDDLRIGGGVILLAYATHDLLFSRARRNRRQITRRDELGPAIAPLGMPILVGPATLSTLAVLKEVHGAVPVLSAFAVATGANALVLVVGPRLIRMTGPGVARATGKVMSLVLAALGAGMVRAGVTAAFS